MPLAIAMLWQPLAHASHIRVLRRSQLTHSLYPPCTLYPVPSPPVFTVCAPSPYVPLLLMCGHPTARVFRFLDKAMEGGLHFGQLTLHLESDPNALDALPALLSLMFSDALKASEGLVSFDDWLVLAKSIPEIQEDGFATSVADLVSTHSAPQHEQPKHCPSTHSTHSIFDSSKLCMLHGAPSLCCTPHADRNPMLALAVHSPHPAPTRPPPPPTQLSALNKSLAPSKAPAKDALPELAFGLSEEEQKAAIRAQRER